MAGKVLHGWILPQVCLLSYVVSQRCIKTKRHVFQSEKKAGEGISPRSTSLIYYQRSGGGVRLLWWWWAQSWEKFKSPSLSPLSLNEDIDCSTAEFAIIGGHEAVPYLGLYISYLSSLACLLEDHISAFAHPLSHELSTLVNNRANLHRHCPGFLWSFPSAQ